LIHLGYLVQDFTRFGALGLSATARPVLRGETTVTLGLPRDIARTEEKTRRRSGAGEGAHRALFEELRAARKLIADAASVPPFVVFSDATLLEMAQGKPRDERELLSITGVGAHKLQKYGNAFLSVINDYRRRDAVMAPPVASVESQSDLSDTQRDTYRLCREGLSLDEIAARRGLKDVTIAAHLEELVTAGLDVDLRRFVAADKLPLIEARLAELGPVSLSVLKEGLPESVNYIDLRLVRRAWGTGS